MSYTIEITARAERDAHEIFAWLSEHSRDGAERWWTAFRGALASLVDEPESPGLAPESDLFPTPVRQVLFRTRRGRRYRAAYVIESDTVRVIGVRAPGRAPLSPDDLD